MNIKIKYIKLITIYSVLFMYFFMNISQVVAQGHASENSAIVFGQISNDKNGAPIHNQEVSIISDTEYNPDFTFNTMLYTDENGYFHDTIRTDILKGGLIFSTKDFQNKIYSRTEYFRFNWSDENIIFADLSIPVDSVDLPFHAAFNHFQNPDDNDPLEFWFFDETNSYDVKSWFWDFGDGETSEIANPTHKFPGLGIYKVSLTVEIFSNDYPNPIGSTITRIVHASEMSYNHLGGHVFAEQFPIDYGAVYLFKSENNNIIPIDTATFNDSLGYYFFYQLVEGDYYVRAELLPNSTLFNEYIDTYYGDELNWSDAEVIEHNNTFWEYNISMIYDSYSNNGIGSIAGMINFNSVMSSIESGTPAQDIEIIIYDMDHNPVECCHSNEDGFFELEDIAFGSYILHAEVIGKQTVPMVLIISDDNYEISDINWVINDFYVNGSVSSISDISIIKSSSNIYPNPVYTEANLEVSLSEGMVVNFSIYSNNGQLMKQFSQSLQPGINNVKFETKFLTSGLYCIKASTDRSLFTKKFIKR